MKAQDPIIDIWKKGKGTLENQQVTDPGRVRSLSRKNISRNRLVMLFYLSFYQLMLAATIVLEIINLGGYRGNTMMVVIHTCVLILSVLISIYGIRLFTRIIRTTRSSLDLVTTIRSQIRIYKLDYEIWLWLMALSLLMVIFAVNTLVDNDNGTYRINNPAVYAAIEAIIFIFMYAMMKAVHYPLLRELRAHLTDLENQTSEATERIEFQKKKWRWWAMAGLVIIMIVLAWVAIGGLLRYS